MDHIPESSCWTSERLRLLDLISPPSCVSSGIIRESFGCFGLVEWGEWKRTELLRKANI